MDSDNHGGDYEEKVNGKYLCADCGIFFCEEQGIAESQNIPRLKCSTHEAKTLYARIFNCKECIEIFTQKSNLSRHLKGHGLKVYHCKDCEASFAHKDYLEKHVMIH